MLESNRWVATTTPPVAKRANATVRSYSASEGAAFVEVVLPEHKTWVLQVWRFDGAKWSDTVGPAPTRPSS